MLLATRCPFCETVFRLQPAQLSQRRGLVRCGHCHEVFDASSSLFETADGGDFSTATPITAAAAIALVQGPRAGGPDFSAEAWDPWAPIADAVIDDRLRHTAANLPRAGIAAGAGVALTLTSRDATEPELPRYASNTGVPRDPKPVFADAPLEPFAYDRDPPPEETPSVWHKYERAAEQPVDEPVLPASAALHQGLADGEPRLNRADRANDLASDRHAATASSGPTAEPFAATLPEDGTDPFPVVRETRAAEPGRAGWIVLGTLVVLLLIVGLLAQLAWWQRETVMVYFPRTQMLYAQACAKLGCQLAPPHDIDGLQVEPSDLRQVDGPHKLELKMPLRNRFNVALAYPAIELTLLDDQNNVAVRRVLWPQDYVAPGTPIAAGLPAHSTQIMIVRLDTGNAVASNFRVQIFYP